MEAQTLLSGVCPKNTTIPLTRIRSFSSVFQPSNCSFARSLKSGFFRHGPISLGACERNNITCNHSAAAGISLVADSSEDSGTAVQQKKLVVFVSGGGSNFRSIYEACRRGSILGDIVALVTNKQGCGGAEFAKENGIPVIAYPRTKAEPDGLSPSNLVASFRELGVDFILLAGYLKLIPAELIRAYPKSIINIHPSLLPAFGGKGFYGMKVHQAVIASGARFSGATMHFVDEHYDTGRILAQRVVPVLPSDKPEDLAARVLREEHRLYVEVVQALCDDRITWREDGVPLIQSKDNANEYS